MGISRTKAWLAVVALSLGPVQGDFVTFDPYVFQGNFDSHGALFLFEELIGHSFPWTSSGVTVEGITLWSDDSKTLLAEAVLLPDAEETLPDNLGRRNPQRNNGGGGVPAQLNFVSNPNGGQVYFTNFNGIPSGQALYFNATWANGYSYSRYFAATGTRVGRPNEKLYISTPAYPESGTPVGQDGDSSETPLTTAATTSTATASPERTGVSDGILGGEPNRPAAGNASSSGGLAQGAIIGIAVGCGVVGLLLILGLIWFLLRRRQKKKAMHPADSTYGSGNRGEELMAEKEAAADVDVTPHSPYTDEGASAGAGPSGTYPDSTAQGDTVVAGAIATPNLSHLQDPPRSFTPYSDRPSAAGTAPAVGTPSSLRAPSLAQTDEPRVSVPSPIPGRATPRGLTTPYAHLVEEGMTDDEIRRLEEEERQLDAAIEQAGRR
ncbi:hypothetical protein B0I37DRAFT_441436 [Chaetomium sp. MPI-CAGE-AT-0009]|nr:hypothetical protein B0I37DRAFT_441436 [Chaetomium sp. MPI-CAGE-AT-0009]